MHVLIVERNLRYAAALSAGLKAETIQAEIAESGEDALYLLRDYEFDLVLLNLLLSDMGCHSLIKQIRTTSIIALSAFHRHA